MDLIIVTGGIGSGKSVVARLLATMGYSTYDCDTRARQLMTRSPQLRQQLTALLGDDIYAPGSGELLRSVVAQRIFGNDELLRQVDTIVHPAVKADIGRWADALASQGEPFAFVETALLEQSGLADMAAQIWLVDAPVPVRIERVVKRSALTPEQVEQRIQAQTIIAPGAASAVITNDGVAPLIPQVVALIEQTTKAQRS